MSDADVGKIFLLAIATILFTPVAIIMLDVFALWIVTILGRLAQ